MARKPLRVARAIKEGDVAYLSLAGQKGARVAAENRAKAKEADGAENAMYDQIMQERRLRGDLEARRQAHLDSHPID